MYKFLLITFVFIFFSCAKPSAEKIRSAIQEAKFYLNSMDCDNAKKILDDLGQQSDNGDYISIYASVYGCKAGYQELTDLFGGNLAKIDATKLITSLATFTTSLETVNDSSAVKNIDLAINTLIGSDGTTQPSTVARNSKFGTAKSGDLSMQALYLIFIAIGKHFALYGDKDPTTGVKGGGGNNTCLYSYTSTDAKNYIAANPSGTCTSATGSEGSALLMSPETAADTKRRLCRGIIYYNNMVDILGNITLPGSSELGGVSAISSALAIFITTAATIESGYNTVTIDKNAITTLKDVRKQSVCEAETIGRIEKFYAILFERIY